MSSGDDRKPSARDRFKRSNKEWRDEVKRRDEVKLEARPVHASAQVTVASLEVDFVDAARYMAAGAMRGCKLLHPNGSEAGTCDCPSPISCVVAAQHSVNPSSRSLFEEGEEEITNAVPSGSARVTVLAEDWLEKVKSLDLPSTAPFQAERPAVESCPGDLHVWELRGAWRVCKACGEPGGGAITTRCSVCGKAHLQANDSDSHFCSTACANKRRTCKHAWEPSSNYPELVCRLCSEVKGAPAPAGDECMACKGQGAFTVKSPDRTTTFSRACSHCRGTGKNQRVYYAKCLGAHTYSPATQRGVTCDRCGHVSGAEKCGHAHGRYGCTRDQCRYGKFEGEP